MKELVGKYKRSNIIGAIVCLIIGLALSWFEFKDYLPFGEMQDLDTLPATEIHEGRGKITVSYILDYYSYWQDNYGREVMRDYYVAAGDENNWAYMGCELRGKKNDRAYDMLEKIIDIETNGGDDYSSLDTFTVTGRVERITGENLKYHTEYTQELADYYGFTQEDIDELFVPYVIIQPQVGDGEFMSYVLAIIGLVLIVAAFGMCGCAIFADPLKNIRAYAKSTGNEELTMSYIENFYAQTPDRYNCKVNDKYFMTTGKGKADFCETKNIIWFYKYVVTRKTNFVTVGHDYYVRIQQANGKMIQLMTRNESEAGDAINYLMKYIPDAIVGYSDELSKMYSKDRGQMIAEVNRRREERMGSADIGL